MCDMPKVARYRLVSSEGSTMSTSICSRLNMEKWPLYFHTIKFVNILDTFLSAAMSGFSQQIQRLPVRCMTIEK